MTVALHLWPCREHVWDSNGIVEEMGKEMWKVRSVGNVIREREMEDMSSRKRL